MFTAIPYDVQCSNVLDDMLQMLQITTLVNPFASMQPHLKFTKIRHP